MRYHLKEDGTAGVCKATLGNCPKGDAIHGDSITEVYSQLESVMKDQLFSSNVYPVPAPRKSALEIGMAGSMMHPSDPTVVQEQMTALAKLGLLDEALPVLEKESPILAAAWRAGKPEAVNLDELYVKPQEYSYEGSDGGAYTSQTETWVSYAHYQLQTVALNSVMDKLETGTLDDVDFDTYSVALGRTSTMVDDYLAFNYNPHRQPDEFFNNVKNRLLKEGLGKEELQPGRTRFTVPAFFWRGLDDERKARVATELLSHNYDTRSGVKRTFEEKALWRTEFGKTLSTVFAYNPQLNRHANVEGEPARFGLGWDDGSVTGTYKFTETGFDWSETAREYKQPKPAPSW
jgi:hypothetical protein